MSGQPPYAVFLKVTGFDSPNSANLDYKVLDATNTDMLVSPGWLDYVTGSRSVGFGNYTPLTDSGIDAHDKFRADLVSEIRNHLIGNVPGITSTQLYLFWIP